MSTVNPLAPCFILFHVMLCPEPAFKKWQEQSKTYYDWLEFHHPMIKKQYRGVKHNTREETKAMAKNEFEEKHVQNGTGGCSGENKVHFTIPRLLPTDTHSCKNCAGTSPVCICFIRTKWFLVKIKMSLALAFLS